MTAHSTHEHVCRWKVIIVNISVQLPHRDDGERQPGIVGTQPGG